MNKNYLKGYPYLFVRESDQTDYFCTLCDAFLKEEELQVRTTKKHRKSLMTAFLVDISYSEVLKINEQGGLVLRITLKRACSFIRDFRVGLILLGFYYKTSTYKCYRPGF
jgi:hypothetical protein